jgi:hypothetical protein
VWSDRHGLTFPLRVRGNQGTIGEYHAAVITEEADTLTGLTGAWTSEAAGHLKTYKLIPLYSVEETLEALRAGDIALQGPSGSTGS